MRIEDLPRPIWKVIDAIKNITPKSYVDRDAYHTRLDKVADDAYYTPPESMGVRWTQLGATLQVFLGDQPDAPWKMTISEIMSKKKDYKDFLKEEN